MRRPIRNLAVDFYRVSGVVVIVFGHWLAACVTYDDGAFGRENPLVDMPWTQWLTWPFQAVPVFFLAAGYASAVSWPDRRDRDESREDWLRRRLARVLGPTTAYVAVVAVVVGVLPFVGVAASTLDYAGWAVAMHLWFLAVYLVLVSLTPLALAAHRRFGLAVPAALAVGVAVVDALSIGAGVPYVDSLNYLFCWAALYQIGIAWRAGLFSGKRSLLLAVGSAIVLALLLELGPYPVSMIGVPGQMVDNDLPPTLAMLAFGLAQAGIAMAAAPLVNRLLRPARLQRVLSVANTNVMALYLWHMIPVVIVALVAYPAGLLPQPDLGTTAWWLARLEWVAVLSAVTAVEISLLAWGKAFFAAPLRTIHISFGRRWAEPAMLVGALMSAYALKVLASVGFAPNGRLPVLTALIFVLGVALVALRPAPVHALSTDVVETPTALE
ncbi:acyltransferase family protein [Mycobacterium sp. MMS18-G62]